MLREAVDLTETMSGELILGLCLITYNDFLLLVQTMVHNYTIVTFHAKM